jgi:hypothetical protein
MGYYFPAGHPVFGTKNKPAPEEHWRHNAYYCWWEFLKRHDGYRKCCDRGGTGPYSRLYRDFGNVHTETFKEWWSVSGRAKHLFAEPKSEHHFGLVDRPLTEDELADSEVLIVRVPLNFPKRFLTKHFQRLLDEHHTGKRGKQSARVSKALYRVQGNPNIPALLTMLRVYDFWREQPRPLWRIAVQLRLFHLENDPPSADERNVAAALVSRYLKKAKLIIENVGKGVFPYSPAQSVAEHGDS